MVDPVRSKIMASIKPKDTKPELTLRRALHRKGFRYRLHYKGLPGRPDLVLPKYNAIILVNGCFWHKHNCHLFNPQRRLSPAWDAKINNNVARDKKNLSLYKELGWKVLVIWECAIEGKTRRPISEVVNTAANWIQFDNQDAQVEGRN